MIFLAVLAVIIILGALVGGKSFGNTVLRGIGCLFAVILILMIFALIVLSDAG